MFSRLFKRAAPAAPVPRRAPAVARTKPQAPVVEEPLPVPEVVEDHDESAWDQWEQSQFQLDSQLGGLSPSDSVRVREGEKKGGPQPDPFAAVGKNHR